MASLLPVLTFHDIAKPQAVISISPGVFQRGLTRLHDNGYRSLKLTETANLLHHGTQFPDRSFVITFDDGYHGVYKESFPVLQRHGMSATVFLTVGEKTAAKSGNRLPSQNGRSMLSWQEIREMHRWGIDFAAHTCTHPDLTHLPVDRAKNEICDSKAIIEDALGAPVSCFAYPYGRFNLQIRNIARQHFSCACSVRLGMISKKSDLYTLERIDAYYLRTDRLFNLMFARGFPWYLFLRNIPRQIRQIFQFGPGK